MPLERQERLGQVSAALHTEEKSTDIHMKVYKFKGTCNWCLRDGQKSAECRSRIAGKPRTRKETSMNSANITKENSGTNSFAFTLTDDHHQIRGKNWIIDSGASHYYSSSSMNLGNCRKDNGTLTSEGCRKLIISGREIHNNNGMVKVVPKIGRNLLSIGQLTQDPDVTLQFSGLKCTVRKGCKISETGTRGQDNLERTSEVSTSLPDSILITTKENTKNGDVHLSDGDESRSSDEDNLEEYNEINELRDWNNRLGHLSKSDICHLARLGRINIKKSELQKELNCINCHKGNSHMR